jgi:putative thioredoxin
MQNEMIDFDKDVIARSFEVPVVVDFWAPTCGPCLFLGPVLEKLATGSEGQWELVKINTNAQNRLAYEHGISSIPHVKMFSKGKLVSEFVGALPEGTLVKWLDQFIPNEEKEQLNAIRERLAGADHDTALADLRAFVLAHPEMQMAAVVLASQIIFESSQEAIDLVKDVKLGDLLWESAENIRLLGELGTYEDQSGTEAGKQLTIAREALHANDFEVAMEAMIAAVEADKLLQKELPRRGAIALFRMFGSQHPLTIKYRRRFEMALS